jgi:hypothetical protein
MGKNKNQNHHKAVSTANGRAYKVNKLSEFINSFDGIVNFKLNQELMQYKKFKVHPYGNKSIQNE